MLRINRCLYRAFFTALLTGTASAQKPLTCQEVRGEVDGLAAVLNYVTPFGFAIGVEPDVSFPAEPANGSAICNQALEMFDTAQATPTNVPAASQDTQPTNARTPSETPQSAKTDDKGFGVPGALSRIGKHDESDETWNLYGQFTTIGFYKPPFHAAYTDLNGSNSSLKPNAETSFTSTLSLFFGLRLRPGTELYIVPEAIAETTL